MGPSVLKLTVLTGIASTACLCASPSQALTLIDNTDGGTRTPFGGIAGNIADSGQAKVAISFTTGANWRPYTQFGFKVPLINAGLAPLTNLTLQIFSADATGIPTGSALFSQTYTSQVGRYSTFLAPFASNAYNSFFIDTVSPILNPSSRYAFVFGSTDLFSSNQQWAISSVNPTSFNSTSFASPLATLRTLNGGTNWGAPVNSPAGFFLDGVPGPLPILGAGSAFAWSRRLRRRVSVARKPDSSATPA
jgi:hypothetical protein